MAIDVAPLDELVEDILDRRGVTPTKLGSEFCDSGHRVISAKLMKEHRLDLLADEARYVDAQTYRRWMTTPIVADDVLLTSEAPLGEVAYIQRDVDWCLGQRLFCIRTDKRKLHGRYLFYCLRGEPSRSDLLARATGTTVQGIRQSELRRVGIPLRPLPEQKRIAQVLGKLDDKIELNRRMNATLEAMSRALFKSWFVDFDPVRQKVAGKQPVGMDAQTGALFPDSFEESEIGEMPQGWESLALYDTATFINGAAFKDEHFCSRHEGLPVVKIAELKNGISEQTKYSTRSDLDPKYRIDTGALLYSWSGSPDTSLDVFLWTLGPGLLNQHIFKIEAASKARKRFVYYLLKHLRPTLVEIARNKQTTGLGHVTVADMRRLKVAFPSSEVLQAFDKRVEPAFEKCFLNKLESEALAALRDTLLPKLLSGEIRAPEAAGIVEEAVR
jgi:type I restriction enzyme S subunit